MSFVLISIGANADPVFRCGIVGRSGVDGMGRRGDGGTFPRFPFVGVLARAYCTSPASKLGCRTCTDRADDDELVPGRGGVPFAVAYAPGGVDAGSGLWSECVCASSSAAASRLCGGARYGMYAFDARGGVVSAFPFAPVRPCTPFAPPTPFADRAGLGSRPFPFPWSALFASPFTGVDVDRRDGDADGEDDASVAYGEPGIGGRWWCVWLYASRAGPENERYWSFDIDRRTAAPGACPPFWIAVPLRRTADFKWLFTGTVALRAGEGESTAPARRIALRIGVSLSGPYDFDRRFSGRSAFVGVVECGCGAPGVWLSMSCESRFMPLIDTRLPSAVFCRGGWLYQNQMRSCNDLTHLQNSEWDHERVCWSFPDRLV